MTTKKNPRCDGIPTRSRFVSLCSNDPVREIIAQPHGGILARLCNDCTDGLDQMWQKMRVDLGRDHYGEDE